jgi:colanic acid biosynthesis glycosyl transferase WcaI
VRRDSNEGISWAVFNQTETQAHQRLFEQLSRELGPCLVLTGSPFPTQSGSLSVKAGPAYHRGTYKQRVTSWLLFAVRALVEGFRLPSGAPVLVVTNPPLLPIVAWLLSTVRGTRYALLIWDIYPDLLVATGLLREKHLLVRRWRSLNKRVLEKASAVITLGEKMAREICSQFADADSAKVQVISNWCIPNEIKPMAKERNSFAVQYDQLDKITVVYAGNIGSGHGVERIVWIAERMKVDPRFSFLIVGDGLGLPKVRTEVSRLKTENVKLLPFQRWETVPEMLASADIAVVMQEKGTESLSMPSKIYSSMAAGSAIMALTAADSDLASIVRKHQMGFVCGQDDIEGAVSVLQGLARDPRKLDAARSRAREAAVEDYSKEVIYDQWLASLQKLVGTASSKKNR